jgi:exonuclease SbcC
MVKHLNDSIFFMFMLLKSLRLENIRSYTNESIEFNEGSSLLLGDIGSGKTTILLALEFALFGFIKGDVSGTTLLRHGKNDGSVELKFNINNQDIIIMRRLKRKKDTIAQDSGYIVMNNKKFEGTPVELKSKILALFGYPEELLNKNTSLIFRYTVYTPQEEMKNILFESREERLDILRRIFNIDKYKRIRENALAYAKELRTMRKILEGKVQDLGQLESTLAQKTADHENIDKIINDNKKILSDLNKEKDAKEQDIRKQQDAIDKINVLKRDFAVAESEMKNKLLENARNNKELSMVDFRIRDYTEKLKGLGEIKDDEQSLRDELKNAEEKLLKINSAKEIIRERLEHKQKELDGLMIEDSALLKYKHDLLIKRLELKDDKEKLHDDAQKSSEEINIQINTINISIANSKKTIHQLKDLSTCPTCLQAVDFSHKVKITDRETSSIASDERRLAELGKKKEDTDQELKRLKHEIESLHKDAIELQQINNKLDNIKILIDRKQQLSKEIEDSKMKKQKLDAMDVNKLIEVISKNRKIVDNIGVRKTVQESLNEKLQQRRDIEEKIISYNDIIEVLKKKCDSITKEILTHADVEKSFNQQKKELETINNNLKDIEIKYTIAIKDKTSIEKDIKKINEDINIKKKIVEKINYINELNHWMTEHFINLTSTIEKNIMHKIHKEFNEIFRNWFSIIVEDEDLDVNIDEDFAPLIRQNNYDTYIDNLSGGEKTAVALAYRLALNKVINDFINTIKTKDILILDEPTDGFSSEQLDRMRDVFEELQMKQLIIVSHEAKMETYANNILRITKHDHNSKATI